MRAPGQSDMSGLIRSLLLGIGLGAPPGPAVPRIGGMMDGIGRQGGQEPPPDMGMGQPQPPQGPDDQQKAGALEQLRALLTQGGMTATNPIADFQRGYAGGGLGAGPQPAPRLMQAAAPDVSRETPQPPIAPQGGPPPTIAAGPQTLQKPTSIIGAMDAMRGPAVQAAQPYAQSAFDMLHPGANPSTPSPSQAPSQSPAPPRIAPTSNPVEQKRWDSRSATLRASGYPDSEIVRMLGPRP